jgi:hypothetical protein
MTTYARRLGLFSATMAVVGGITAGFLVPGYPWTPALFVVASSVLANPRNAAIGTTLLLLGIPVYLWWSRPRRAPVGSGEGGTT